VTDKTDPIQLSRTEYAQTGYTHQGWLSDDRGIVYMNDEVDELDFGFNTRTMIMDVSDLDNPFLIQEYYGETEAIDHNLYVKGDKVFEANYNAGMRVLQISDVPEAMLDEVGFFDINIIISGIDQGLFVVGSSTITANDVDPMLANCADTPSGIRALDKPIFSVYPVPTNDALYLTSKTGERILQWQVFDITGRVVKTSGNVDIVSHLAIEVSDLSAGTYFVSVNNYPVTQKFIVK